jgi:putative addiction module component (TIGR02574 family)
MGEIKIADIRAMTVEQRLDLIERVWDTLAETPDAIPVPDWHEDALKKRLGAFEQNPDEGASWDEVERRITRRS